MSSYVKRTTSDWQVWASQNEFLIFRTNWIYRKQILNCIPIILCGIFLGLMTIYSWKLNSNIEDILVYWRHYLFDRFNIFSKALHFLNKLSEHPVGVPKMKCTDAVRTINSLSIAYKENNNNNSKCSLIGFYFWTCFSIVYYNVVLNW